MVGQAFSHLGTYISPVVTGINEKQGRDTPSRRRTVNLLTGVAVELQVAQEIVGPGMDRGGHEYPIATAAGEDGCARAVGGNMNWRAGLLDGFGHDLDRVEVVVVAVVGETRAGPGPLDNVQRFFKALAALLPGNAKGLEILVPGPATGPELQPAIAQHVNRGGLFGNVQGVVERQLADADSEPDACGLGGQGGGHSQRPGHDREDGVEVRLGQPDRVKAERIGVHDLLQGLAITGLHRLLGSAWELIKNTTLHRNRPLKSFLPYQPLAPEMQETERTIPKR